MVSPVRTEIDPHGNIHHPDCHPEGCGCRDCCRRREVARLLYERGENPEWARFADLQELELGKMPKRELSR